MLLPVAGQPYEQKAQARGCCSRSRGAVRLTCRVSQPSRSRSNCPCNAGRKTIHRQAHLGSKGSPEGSPTRPVAPPSRATGRCPQRWNQVSTMMPSRLPRCRLSAVGSKPQYTVRAPAPAAFSSASLVVSYVTKGLSSSVLASCSFVEGIFYQKSASRSQAL